MTVEERIGAADRRKMDGNALFKEEKLEEAMQQYEMVTHLYSLDMTLSFYVYTPFLRFLLLSYVFSFAFSLIFFFLLFDIRL